MLVTTPFFSLPRYRLDRKLDLSQLNAGVARPNLDSFPGAAFA